VATALNFVHIVSALLFVAGYVATNLLTEFARRDRDPVFRRTVLRLSTMFDRRLNAPFGTITAVAGIAAAVAYGYSFFSSWIAYSTVLLIAIIILGGTFWAPRGRRLESALASDDWPGVDAVLLDPRSILMSRVENLLMLAIITLMVFRPG
jgi:uncharacterized membrane protein